MYESTEMTSRRLGISGYGKAKKMSNGLKKHRRDQRKHAKMMNTLRAFAHDILNMSYDEIFKLNEEQLKNLCTQ